MMMTMKVVRSVLLALAAGGIFFAGDQRHPGGVWAAEVFGGPCDSVITTVTVEEVKALTDAWIDIILPASDYSEANRTAARQVYTAPLQYDLLVSKVCGSCAEFMDQINASDVTGSWTRYCGTDQYGYDATHSALVFHPMDPTADSKPLAATLNVSMTFQSSRFDLSHAFSTAFPVNVDQTIQALRPNDDALKFVFENAYSLMVAASSGLIAIGPDWIGMGASADFNRTYLTRMPVEQAAVVSWFATQKYTNAVTNGCTAMGGSAVTHGYSSAGADALWGSLTLEQLGVDIVQQFSMAGAYNLPLLMQGIVGPILQNPNATLQVSLSLYVTLVQGAYSNEMPFLRNSGTNETLLSEEWRLSMDTATDLLTWLYVDKLLLNELIPLLATDGESFLSSINPATFPAIAAAGAVGSFCDPQFASTDVLVICQTLTENSAFTAVPSVAHPIQRCHSPGDNIIPPFFSALFLPSAAPNINTYTAAYDFMEPRGDHGTGFIFCNAALPTLLLNHGILNQRLIESNNDGGLCNSTEVVVDTEAPTKAPTLEGSTLRPTGSPNEEGTTATPTSMPSDSASMLRNTWMLVMMIPLALVPSVL